MYSGLRRWGHGALAMSFLFVAAALPVQTAPAVSVQAQLGIGGWLVPGRFAPLRVEVTADLEVRAVLEVEVRGPAGESVTHTRALRLPQGGRQQLAFDIVISDPRRDVLIRVQDGGREGRVVALPVGVARTAEGIVVALTRDPAGLEFLAASAGKRRPAYLETALLPLTWQGYDAVDLVVIRDLDQRALLPAQQEALLGWVAQGGRLLVTPHDGLSVPAWLRPLLPARVSALPSTPAEAPVPLLRLEADPTAAVTGDRKRPLAVRGRFGRGMVEVWAFDPFSPEGRAWPGRLGLWRALLDAPRVTPVAARTLADELPRTRPLPGRTQLVLALLSAAYIVVIRAVLRRFGGSRGGWAVVVAAVAVFAVMLFASAAGARRAAGSIAQVSIIEGLPGAERARAATMVSLITPYGGRVSLRLPEEAAVRPSGSGSLRIIEGEQVLSASDRGGQGVIEIGQIVSLDLHAAAVERNGALDLVMTGGSPWPADALLYRRRQMYRIGGTLGPRTTLDPARWEPVDRAGVLGSDLAARASGWLFTRLDATGGEMWLVGRTADRRVGVRLPDGGSGLAVQLLLIPVTLR